MGDRTVRMLHPGSLAPPIQCNHGPPPTLHQWEEDDYEMSRPGNPLRECFCHIGSKVLSDILLKSSVALLVIKEKIGGSWAIHLHMLQILKCGISLQDKKDLASIPRECGWTRTPRSIRHSDFQQQSIFLSWGLDHSYLRFQGCQHIQQTLDGEVLCIRFGHVFSLWLYTMMFWEEYTQS